MSSQEETNEVEQEVGETTDKRLFDADGNIREDVAEEREAIEEPEEELSLELLARRIQTLEGQTIQAMEQVDATFNQVGQEMNNLTQQVRTTISDMHVRLGVIEEIMTNPDLQDDRAAFCDGTLTMDRYKAVAEEIVLPDMKVKAEAMQKKMQERFARIQARIQSGASPEEAVAAVNQEDEEAQASEGDSGIEVVSG
jgi:hypothetical protein